ncbi:hypothetical protein WJX82_010928 [Trebouxia sp. C0006]
MFQKANTKGLESLLHFLLTKLRGISQSKKDFKGVWPIKDTRQQKDYRKVLHTLLSELEHEEKLPRRLVAALQSMFTTAAGARVTELLCHLSCYVLGQQMQEHHSQEARHTSYGHTKVQETLVPLELMEPAMMVAMAQGRQQCKRFMANAATYSSMQGSWQSAADHLMGQYKHLLQQQQQQQKAKESLIKDASTNRTLNDAQQQEQLHQAEHIWGGLQEHLQSLVDLQKLVDSVIDSTTHPHAIDGQKLSRHLQSADDDADMHKGTADQPQAAYFASNSIDIVQLLQGLTEAVATYGPRVSALAGHGEAGSMTLLALPAEQGGHQSHLAAALTTSVQHLNQQKQVHAALQADLGSIAAYRQALVHQVAAAMQPAPANGAVGQENVTPTAGTSSNRQEARLHLVPPTPLSTAPMQAAAVSVAATRNALQERTWSALTPSQGGTAMKASVHQAAMVREHKWTPGGARMPLKLAMPPSTVRPTTRSRMERHHGPAMMTSVVKRGRDLLAPSPISEEDEGAWGNVAGPRRLSYSSPNDQEGRTPAQQTQENGHQKSTPADATIFTVTQSTAKPTPEVPLSVAALLARMQKLKSTK